MLAGVSVPLRTGCKGFRPMPHTRRKESRALLDLHGPVSSHQPCDCFHVHLEKRSVPRSASHSSCSAGMFSDWLCISKYRAFLLLEQFWGTVLPEFNADSGRGAFSWPPLSSGVLSVKLSTVLQ